MKFDDVGDVIAFEVGDVFDDPWGNLWEIRCTKAHLCGGNPQESWVIYCCDKDGKILINSTSDLKNEFNEPLDWNEDNESEREHLYQFKYNIIDESNKSVKVKFSFEVEV